MSTKQNRDHIQNHNIMLFHNQNTSRMVLVYSYEIEHKIKSNFFLNYSQKVLSFEVILMIMKNELDC